MRFIQAFALALTLGFSVGTASASCTTNWTPTTATVCHSGYEAVVSRSAKVPVFVTYTLTGPHTLGCLKRKNNFHTEPLHPADARAQPSDYTRIGYDRGHQAPAQDFAWDADELSESFSMANMAPQRPGLNRQEWERLEETVRAWAWKRGTLDIYVGPVLAADDATIGKDKVDVPASFWKVVVDREKGEAIGFMMPNRSVAKGPLDPYQVPIVEIEHATGLHIPLPAGIDASAKPSIWQSDLSGWRSAHTKACSP